MSSQSNKLRCNRCWNYLEEDRAYITTCSHIFCEKDARSWFTLHSECPCCQNNLNRQTELKEIHLLLSHEQLATKLCGMPPSDIVEVVSSALSFWEYQKRQESSFFNYRLSQKDNKIRELEKGNNEKLVEVNNHIKILNNIIESLKNDLKVQSNAYSQLEADYLEKQRQCNKYEHLYNINRGNMKVITDGRELLPSKNIIPNKIKSFAPSQTYSGFRPTPNHIAPPIGALTPNPSYLQRAVNPISPFQKKISKTRVTSTPSLNALFGTPRQVSTIKEANKPFVFL